MRRDEVQTRLHAVSYQNKSSADVYKTWFRLEMGEISQGTLEDGPQAMKGCRSLTARYWIASRNCRSELPANITLQLLCGTRLVCSHLSFWVLIFCEPGPIMYIIICYKLLLDPLCQHARIWSPCADCVGRSSCCVVHSANLVSTHSTRRSLSCTTDQRVTVGSPAE